MNNRKAFKIIEEETHGAQIENLFWIAASFESKSLKDILEEINDDDIFNKVFKLDDKIEIDDPVEALIDNNKLGFLAEVHYPVLRDFKYKDGSVEPWTWSGGKGNCRIEYIYEEIFDNLLLSIEDKAAKLFTEFKNHEFKKNNKK